MTLSRDAGKTVPRAMIWALVAGGVTSFVLVAALILAIPSKGFSSVASFSGGIPIIINNATGSHALRDIILLLVCYAFLSCGTSVQAAATRVMFSYARDDALPGNSIMRRVSHTFHTPITAVVTSFVVASLFSLLVWATPAKNITVLFVTYPANINALLVLVSFGVSGIYISFLMITVATLIARTRGWKPLGSFSLGRWAWPVNIGAVIYGAIMLLNVIYPSGINSPPVVLLNFDWMTLIIAVFIGLAGLVYLLVGRPDLK
jgi:amino acid transporter